MRIYYRSKLFLFHWIFFKMNFFALKISRGGVCCMPAVLLFLYMTLVTLKIRLGPPTDASVPVWSKSGHWFRSLEFRQWKNRPISQASIIS